MSMSILRIRHIARRALPAAFMLLSAGCPPPGQSGGVSPRGGGVIIDEAATIGVDATLTPLETRGDTVMLTACRNETIAFQIVVRGGGSAQVEISAPTLEGGAITLDVFKGAPQPLALADMDPAVASQADLPRADWVIDTLEPITLDTQGRANVALSGPMSVLWFDAHVPADAQTGDYVGRVRVSRGGAAVANSELRLLVLPVTLPAEPSLIMLARVDPRDLLRATMNWPNSSAEEARVIPDLASHAPAAEALNDAMRGLRAHRLTPALWASFPKFRPTGPRAVEIEWEAYDALVSSWLDGSAFEDGAPLRRWLLPVSDRYPDAARNGGFGSPAYARVLQAYVEACEAHFRERGWLDRSIIRMIPPDQMTTAFVDRNQRVAGILNQRNGGAPLLAHLPPRSLESAGWPGAPRIELRGVDGLCPPAAWIHPDQFAQAAALRGDAWFMPDAPPYAGSLALGAPPTDVTSLGWLAYRYGIDRLWIEHATDSQDGATALLTSGRRFGAQRPAQTVRLKGLRRAQQDFELLTLLAAHGAPALADTLAERLAPYGFQDACRADLLDCYEAAWSDDPRAYATARELIRRELAAKLAPGDAATQIATARGGGVSEWTRVLARGLRIEPRGARLRDESGQLVAALSIDLLNQGETPLSGAWSLAAADEGVLRTSGATDVGAGRRDTATIDVTLTNLNYSADGVYPLRLVYDTRSHGAFETAARIAATACPLLQSGPRVDGDLSDWPEIGNNRAGDFVLVRGERAGGRRPRLGTRAQFCLDAENLYIGIECDLQAGERPIWSADNRVNMAGAIPWGQELVEVLLAPRGAETGGPGDLLCLQVKPGGVLIAREGCATEPPIAPSRPWQSDARVAVGQERGAWTVELAIPLRSLGAEAMRQRVWGVNVSRFDAGAGEYSSWSGARWRTYDVDTLGNLILLWP